MSEILNLQPENVFRFFYEINQIPRGSGNEKAISDYLYAFAKERNLEAFQDEALNVFIRKPATAGYENKPGIILQGHMDMVCSKNGASTHNFEKDPIKMLVTKEGTITADGTTLGADNGIAVAMSLAVLDAKDIEHPMVEVVITTDEEVGLNGAKAFDTSVLKGTKFINIDSEEEGEFTVSCAGGLRSVVKQPVKKTALVKEGNVIKEIEIKNLIGGHSGVDIHLGRCNANKLMGRVLFALDGAMDIHLLEIYGGEKDNVIPREATATITISKADEALFNETLDALSKEIEGEYVFSDKNIEIVSSNIETDVDEVMVYTEHDLETTIFLLMSFPNGVQDMSQAIEGLVETSLNLGIVSSDDDHIVYQFAVRSSLKSKKELISKSLELLATYTHSEYEEHGVYPEWPLKEKSQFLDDAVALFEEKYGNKPIVKGIHAGLECGVFLETRPDLEAISIGPDMGAVHSPDEWLHIESTKRTYEFLLDLLKI